MTTKPHKKHAKLNKPLGGRFHRNEVALIGAPCEVIQKLSSELVQHLPKELRVGYADAAHKSDVPQPDFHTLYTDRISHHAVEFNSETMDYHYRSLFEHCDLVVINGNHYVADAQIVLINEKKKESLQRKLDRLTNVRMFVLDEGQSDIYDFLKTHIPDYQEIPVVSIREVDKISAQLAQYHKDRVPGLKGLVLAGGKSLRMGQDKGSIDYHGKPQREHAADLLSKVCAETYLSVRSAEVDFQTRYPLLVDQFHDLGPYGGILSALKTDPNSAWLVTATDIPLLDQETLEQLITYRNTSKVATCFHNPETNFPEPLITIWEPKAYSKLLYFLSLGYSCPRKALINCEVEELEIDRKEVLSNVNTPEELSAIRTSIHG